MTSDIRESLQQRLLEHLTHEESVEMLLNITQPTERFYKWIGSGPATMARTKTIAEYSNWLASAFAALEITGQSPVTEEQRKSRIDSLVKLITRSDINRAIARNVGVNAGSVLNSFSLEIAEGQLMIRRYQGFTKVGKPYDFIVLNDNSDELLVTCLTFGQSDDSDERIIKEIQKRLNGNSIVEAERQITDSLFRDHFRYVKERLRVRFVYVGGPDVVGQVSRAGTRMIEGFLVEPTKMFLETIVHPSPDFKDYLENGSASDPYETGTRVEGDEILNNARFANTRRCLDLEEWHLALRLMSPHHRLVNENIEILTAIQSLRGLLMLPSMTPSESVA